MATRQTIKSWFQRGLRPTAAQFAEWIDSFVHNDDSISQSKVSGLVEELAGIKSSRKDEACGEDSIVYRDQAIPYFTDLLDLSLDYDEQIIIVSGVFKITNSQLKRTKVIVAIHNATNTQINIKSEMPQSMIDLKNDYIISQGATKVVTFVKTVDGTSEYDPANEKIRIY